MIQTVDDRAPAAGSRAGVLFGLAAYGMWGLVPIYFKLVVEVPALEILAHRVLWSVVVLAAILLWQRQWQQCLQVLRSWRTLRDLLVSTILIAVNWFVFIWAVANDLILEASLGYFINPLVNVLLGVLFLRERLSKPVRFAVLLAAIGVAAQVVVVGRLPLIALTLAFSFGIYGLVRKIAAVGATVGLFVETLLLSPFALAYVLWLHVNQQGVFATGSLSMDGLLMAAGLVTAVPLIFFNRAARLLQLTTMGFLQYLAPTGHFLLAVLAYGEALDLPRVFTFGCIWCALVIFSWSQLRSRPAR